jgi:hypothetical protein
MLVKVLKLFGIDVPAKLAEVRIDLEERVELAKDQVNQAAQACPQTGGNPLRHYYGCGPPRQLALSCVCVAPHGTTLRGRRGRSTVEQKRNIRLAGP